MDYLRNVTRDQKIMMLAYDQGLEHGPAEDFDEHNFDPNYILDIADQGDYTCTAMQFSIAQKFWQPKYSHIPLVVKLNGKTNLGPRALSVANSSVEDALSIGASGVGYTIYLGSEYEAEMIREFSQIRDEAHQHNLAVFAWMYPFVTPPSSNDDERDWEIVAYAVRAGAELGADVVKVKYPHQPEHLSEILRNAVGCKAVLSGGDRHEDKEFLDIVDSFMKAGGHGLAVGRNVWQHPKPLELTEKIKSVIWK